MKQSFLNIGKIFSPKQEQEEREAYLSLKKISIAKWWEVIEEGNYNALVIKGEFTDIEIQNIFIDLLQQYHDAFGTTEKHKQFLQAKFEYVKKLAKYVSSQAPVDKMFLQMAEIDFKELTPRSDEQGKPLSLGEEIAIIEEHFAGEKDEDTLSACKFYTYKKRIREKIEAHNQIVNSWRKR